MIRQIIIPQQAQHIIQFPTEMIGKQVEVIAFELPGKEAQLADAASLEEFRKSFDSASFPTNGWKFSRDEANDYE